LGWVESGNAARVDGIVRIPRRVGGRRSRALVEQVPVERPSNLSGSAYRVERDWSAGEARFIVVGPSGVRLYWFSDQASADAEVRSLQRAARLTA